MVVVVVNMDIAVGEINNIKKNTKITDQFFITGNSSYKFVSCTKAIFSERD